MKTLDYLHLDESAAGKLVQSLQQLLADFQVHYMNLRGFHWNIQGHGFFVLHSKFEEMYDDTAEKGRSDRGAYSDARRCSLEQVQRVPEDRQSPRDRRRIVGGDALGHAARYLQVS